MQVVQPATRHQPLSQEAPANILQCLWCLLKVQNQAVPITSCPRLVPPAKTQNKVQTWKASLEKQKPTSLSFNEGALAGIIGDPSSPETRAASNVSRPL